MSANRRAMLFLAFFPLAGCDAITRIDMTVESDSVCRSTITVGPQVFDGVEFTSSYKETIIIRSKEDMVVTVNCQDGQEWQERVVQPAPKIYSFVFRKK